MVCRSAGGRGLFKQTVIITFLHFWYMYDHDHIAKRYVLMWKGKVLWRDETWHRFHSYKNTQGLLTRKWYFEHFLFLRTLPLKYIEIFSTLKIWQYEATARERVSIFPDSAKDLELLVGLDEVGGPVGHVEYREYYREQIPRTGLGQ